MTVAGGTVRGCIGYYMVINHTHSGQPEANENRKREEKFGVHDDEFIHKFVPERRRLHSDRTECPMCHIVAAANRSQPVVFGSDTPATPFAYYWIVMEYTTSDPDGLERRRTTNGHTADKKCNPLEPL